MRLVVGGFALVWALAAPVSGRDIIVDNRLGNDVNEGTPAGTVGKYEGPLRTIGMALRIARQGDRILLAKNDEPYRESIALSAAHHCGRPGRPFEIDGQGATLDGTALVPPDAWEAVGGHIFRFSPDLKSHQQLFLDGRPALAGPLDPVAPLFADLEPMTWYRHEGYLYLAVHFQRLPVDYALSYSVLRTGVTVDHVHDVMIRNLTVQGFQIDGIQLSDGVSRATLLDVVSRGNGRAGVTVGGTSHVLLRGSVLGDNRQAQLLTSGPSRTYVDNCELLPALAPEMVRRGGLVVVDGQELPAEDQ